MNLLLFNLKTDADDDVLGFTTDWINALASHVHRIVVLTMSVGRVAVADNVVVYSVGKERGFSEVQRGLEFYRLLIHILRRERIDACFAHMIPEFVVLGWPILRLRKIPILLWYAHKATPWRMRLAHRLADRAVTSFEAAFRVKSDKVRVIGQGIDTDRFVPPLSARPPDTPFTVLTVGRISRIKRLEILLEAVVLLRERIAAKPFRVVIVGGPITEVQQTYAMDLAGQSRRLGIDPWVTFVGSVPFPRILPFYQGADCFVNLCPTGAIDKAAMEAMSCGLVVVAANETLRTLMGNDLAKDWVLEDVSPERLAGRLERAFRMPAQQRTEIGLQLRELVVKGHSLQSLSQRIVQECDAMIRAC